MCGRQGRWVGAAQSCREVVCPALSMNIDAMRNGYSCTNGSSIGSSCRIKCRAGHRHNNGSILKCLPGGAWSDASQDCERIPKKCPMPIEIEGDGMAFCNGNQEGAICDIDCPYGYVRQGNEQLECGNDGKWIGQAKCIEPYCDPLNVVNANVFCLDEIANLGTRCRATCNNGFRVQERHNGKVIGMKKVQQLNVSILLFYSQDMYRCNGRYAIRYAKSLR